ncbi:MAG: Preprotein translocase subunit SecD [Parcubacteria group bacterium GW2011_GWA1_40_21]|nr:MAG: Preprotein translocase subunit SecD [Parcubacteria group bacterium GW2011_GWA1_40_21]
MFKYRIWALVLIFISAGIGYFVYSTENKDSSLKFKLGLDLNGGTELVYRADTSKVDPKDIRDRMLALRDVIEKRVNPFGVGEQIVQIEKAGVLGSNQENRLIVALPGITNVEEAKERIGKTPLLEFKLIKPEVSKLKPEEIEKKTVDELFTDTGLTGRLLKNASLEFGDTLNEPMVALQFNSEGEELFAKITKENVDETLAIFLDGNLISRPVIREEIRGGRATISGGFTGQSGLKEARDLVANLNLGALPVPIEGVSTQTVGASLGSEALNAGIKAGVYAFIIIAIFLIIWYRVPGLLAVLSLSAYVAINLALYKIIPVTMTSAGIAGFILSVGMAVDANILIFERMREELKRGRGLEEAMKEGFSRAWLSIRDSNISSIITALVLFIFSSNSIVKGFALVFGIGVGVSMFTAITVSRTFLFAVKSRGEGRLARFLFSSGIRN